MQNSKDRLVVLSNFSNDEVEFLTGLVKSETLRAESLRGMIDDKIVDRLQVRNNTTYNLLASGNLTLTERQVDLCRLLVVTETDRMLHWQDRIDSKTVDRLKKRNSELANKLKSYLV